MTREIDSRRGCKLLIEDDELIIGMGFECEIIDIPLALVENKDVVNCIFDAYINLEETAPEVIYKTIRE